MGSEEKRVEHKKSGTRCPFSCLANMNSEMDHVPVARPFTTRMSRFDKLKRDCSVVSKDPPNCPSSFTENSKRIPPSLFLFFFVRVTFHLDKLTKSRKYSVVQNQVPLVLCEYFHSKTKKVIIKWSIQ